MATRFHYDVSISKSEKGKSEFVLNVHAEQIGLNPDDALNAPPVHNEAEAGALFGKIMAHNQLSIVVPDDDPHVVHRFHVLPLDRPILDVSVRLVRVTSDDRGVRFQSFTTLELFKVKLLVFQPPKMKHTRPT